MAKPKIQYRCTNPECGKVTSINYGACNLCHAKLEQFDAAVANRSVRGGVAGVPTSGQPKRIREITTTDERVSTNIGEFDRVMGGGITIGSVTLFGGAAGAGKSTLTLEVANQMALFSNVLYVSGEESESQLAQRARRLNIDPDNLYVIYENVIENVIAHIHNYKPQLVIIDSITTMTSLDVAADKSANTQSLAAAGKIINVAKTTGTCVIMISHVTKDGLMAGSNQLIHDVDTVLYIEGDMYNVFRLLRTVKNRFGPIGEVGVFEMLGDGMKGVNDPSRAFVGDRMEDAIGSSITVIVEGQRPLLVELQALTSPANGGAARVATGVNRNRLMSLVAAVSQHVETGIDFSATDLYFQTVGGIDIEEPAAGLAQAMAIISSALRQPIGHEWVFIGEVLLTGQIRAVMQMDWRIREAANLGFSKILVPKTARGIERIPNILIREVQNLQEAVDIVFVGR